MKKYLTLILFPTISIIILSIIFSIINLFEININKFFYLIFIIIITLITGFIYSNFIKNKAYIKGFILGIIISLIMFLLSILLLSNHSVFNILYYMILTASTTLGTVIGINKKQG